MHIHLTQQDGVPVYLQILNQIKQLIASRRLMPRQELPAIRVLAEQLLINPNTVARAYRELENAGWVYKKRGAGTFVSEQNTPLSLEACRQIIGERINGLVTEAGHMNIPTEEVISMIRQAAKDRKRSI